MSNVLASAAGVIGNSQVTVDELAAFASKRGKPIPSSVTAWLGGADLPLNSKPRHAPRPHFVVVGTIEGRKNHQLLLNVWRKIVEERGSDAPSLVIIGQRGWQADSVFDQLDRPGELEGHVLEYGTCDDDELAGWIAGAEALLMPSFADIGLPVIEALQIGTPVIASDLPVYREIASKGPTYLDPTDEAAWNRTIGAFSDRTDRPFAPPPAFHAPTWQEHFGKVDAWLSTL